MIQSQYPALLIVVPLMMAFVVALAGWTNRRVGYYLSVATLTVVTYVCVDLLIGVVRTGPVLYKMAGWTPPMGISYYIDALNGLVLAVVAVVSLVNLIATKAAVEKEMQEKTTAFYTLYLLSVCGHLGMVATGDAFNLYVLLEIAALSGYALLALGNERAALSTLNYLFIGTIGASFYLMGVGFLYIQTGSLNMLDISSILATTGTTNVVAGAFGLIMVGVMIKMAFFPMHAWLPNAYSHASSPASSLIAPMTTKVMVYVMIRMMLTVFTPDITFSLPAVADVIVWAACAAIVFGGAMALSSKNLKKMLTYVLIAEVGYMVGGAWLGNKMGMTGAILHIANDAMMTLVVFLAAGAIGYRVGSLDLNNLQGLFKKMPYTMGAFVLAATAMIGVPPTCGFFSKWYLLLGGIDAGHWGFVCALIFSSLVNVVLFFKIFEICFFEPFAEHGDGEHHGSGHAPAVPLAEAPVLMVVTLIAASLGLVAMGLYTSDLVRIIQQAIPSSLI